MSSLAIGTMSGTSLDGIDIALCRFSCSQAGWTYELVDTQTVKYPAYWIGKIKNAPMLKADEFLLLHNEYGVYTGNLINEFLHGKEVPQLIASHGHTIFHEPDIRLTFQLGNGASIAATTGITTVSDFRGFDVALGGQGAPLVPFGDQHLFPEFDYCLNIGGFANISYAQNGVRTAFDICPANIVLNEIAQKKGYEYDRAGHLGASGTIHQSVLNKLNSLDYYRLSGPKSLGREWVDHHITPLIGASGLSVEDQAATIYEHIATQIATVAGTNGRILVTGGGAKNLFLLDRIRLRTTCALILPDEQLIDFKEALIFAFLGVLALNGSINISSTVTGSKQNHIGGVIYPVGNK